jgi:hypothetical protein
LNLADGNTVYMDYIDCDGGTISQTIAYTTAGEYTDLCVCSITKSPYYYIGGLEQNGNSSAGVTGDCQNNT